jgi:glucose-1-phosphatase
MQKYSVVVFDLGNVLIPFDYSKVLSYIDSKRPGMGAAFAEYYKENYQIHRSYERGDISDKEFIDIMLKAIDYVLTPEEFCKCFSEIFTVNTNVTELLPKLKQNYRLMLLSNTSHIHQQYGWGHYEFLKNFEHLFLSHEVNAVKPEPKIYQTVMNYTKAPASEHIFIDDVAEYGQGAKDQGWNAIQFVGYDNLVAELHARGILY